MARVETKTAFPSSAVATLRAQGTWGNNQRRDDHSQVQDRLLQDRPSRCSAKKHGATQAFPSRAGARHLDYWQMPGRRNSRPTRLCSLTSLDSAAGLSNPARPHPEARARTTADCDRQTPVVPCSKNRCYPTGGDESRSPWDPCQSFPNSRPGGTSLLRLNGSYGSR